tara:strand:- start:40 stop:198 length:159 start_codon:yes stop_codon:yes gene_type:complete
MVLPKRKISIHPSMEFIVVVADGEMNQFVYDYVLEAVQRLLEEFEIEPDPFR